VNRTDTLRAAACGLAVALATLPGGCQSGAFHRNPLPRRHAERTRAEGTTPLTPPAPAPVEVPAAPPPAPAKPLEAAPMHTTAPAPLPVPTQPASAPQPAESADAGPAKLRSLYQQAAERYAGLPAYTAQLRRREQVNGKDKPEEVMLFKFRQEPWSVYFKWLGPPSPGREVVFVKGQNGGQIHTLLAQGDMPLMPAGKVLSLAPDNHFVRASSRHSITDAGIGTMIEQFGRLVAAGGALRYVGPTPRREFPSRWKPSSKPSRPAARPRCPAAASGSGSSTPRAACRSWSSRTTPRGTEVEFYCYERVQVAAALTDDDFNPEKLWKK
jgi:hypothetical protein